jgi:CHAT domain-containing protein
MASHPVVYLGGLLPSDIRRTAEKTESLVIGQADQGLDALSGEASEIKKLLRADALTSTKASVSRVIKALPSASIIHIAAHAVIDEDNPYESYIVLNDGHLKAWQLFQAARNSNLLVLSTCDSQRAADRPSAGYTPAVAALAYTPTIAALATLGGARRTVASMRPADDESTAALMLSFYKHLKNDPARALFQARTEMLSGGANPVRFANFTLLVQDIQSILMQ